MKQNFVFAILFMCSMVSFSQDTKFSVELNYPIPIGDNFMGDHYSGIIDAGLKYRFLGLDFLKVGASLNVGFLNNSKADYPGAEDVTLLALQPRVFGEIDTEAFGGLRPWVGLGYSIMRFGYSPSMVFNPENPETANSSQTESGFNINVGLAYNFTERFFGQVQYDFVKIGVQDEVPETSYNTNINIVKVGVGYRF